MCERRGGVKNPPVGQHGDARAHTSRSGGVVAYSRVAAMMRWECRRREVLMQLAAWRERVRTYIHAQGGWLGLQMAWLLGY